MDPQQLLNLGLQSTRAISSHIIIPSATISTSRPGEHRPVHTLIEGLKYTFGNVLASCLQELVEIKPSDPITFIAMWLYKYSNNQRYYLEKLQFLQELEKNTYEYNKALRGSFRRMEKRKKEILKLEHCIHASKIERSKALFNEMGLPPLKKRDPNMLSLPLTPHGSRTSQFQRSRVSNFTRAQKPCRFSMNTLSVLEDTETDIESDSEVYSSHFTNSRRGRQQGTESQRSSGHPSSAGPSSRRSSRTQHSKRYSASSGSDKTRTTIMSNADEQPVGSDPWYGTGTTEYFRPYQHIPHYSTFDKKQYKEYLEGSKGRNVVKGGMSIAKLTGRDGKYRTISQEIDMRRYGNKRSHKNGKHGHSSHSRQGKDRYDDEGNLIYYDDEGNKILIDPSDPRYERHRTHGYDSEDNLYPDEANRWDPNLSDAERERLSHRSRWSYATDVDYDEGQGLMEGGIKSEGRYDSDKRRRHKRIGKCDWRLEGYPTTIVCEHSLLGKLRTPHRSRKDMQTSQAKPEVMCESEAQYSHELYTVPNPSADDDAFKDKMLFWNGENWKAPGSASVSPELKKEKKRRLSKSTK